MIPAHLDYPRMMFHRTKDPVTVQSRDEEDELGPEWSRKIWPPEPEPDPDPEPDLEPEREPEEEIAPVTHRPAQPKPAPKRR